MRKSFPAAHKGTVLLVLLAVTFTANAGDITSWEPTTAAGGAPVPPAYWNQQASYQFFPAASMLGGNVVFSDSDTTLTDNSASTTNTTLTDYSTHTDNSANTTNTSSSGSQVNYNPVSRDGSTLSNTNTTTITP